MRWEAGGGGWGNRQSGWKMNGKGKTLELLDSPVGKHFPASMILMTLDIGEHHDR